MKNSYRLFFLNLFFMMHASALHANDCFLLGTPDDTQIKYCCKKGGNHPNSFKATEESCSYHGDPGIVHEFLNHKLTEESNDSSYKEEEILEEGAHDFTDYSLNLMWINQDLDRNGKYIFPAKNEEELKNNFLMNIKKWASSMREESTIQLWYDSDFVYENASEETQKVLEKVLGDTSNRIVFRDVRDLEEVKEHEKVFSETMPINFRFDLLRAMIAYHSLMDHENEYFVYADLDVTPLSEEDIFDEKTKKTLEDFGIVMARDYRLGFENAFQITSQDFDLLKAIKKVLIDVSINQANSFFEMNQGQNFSKSSESLNQIVYDNYKTMFDYFYHLKGWGKLMDHSRSISKIELLPITAFGAYPKRKGLHLENKNEKIHSIKSYFHPSHGTIEHQDEAFFPTKQVTRPNLHLGGMSKRSEDYISVKKYPQKLLEALEDTEGFDNVFLHLAVRNNDIKSIKLIESELDVEDFAQAFGSKSKSYNDDQLTPFSIAIEEGKKEIIEIVMDSLSERPDLLQQVVKTMEKSTFLKKGEREINNFHVEFLKWLFETCADDEVLLGSLSKSLLVRDLWGMSFFEKSIITNHLSIIEMIADALEKYPELFSEFMLSTKHLKDKKFSGANAEMMGSLRSYGFIKQDLDSQEEEEDK
jgi:hypothetical protein